MKSLKKLKPIKNYQVNKEQKEVILQREVDKWKYIKNKNLYPNIHLIIYCTEKQKYDQLCYLAEKAKESHLKKEKEYKELENIYITNKKEPDDELKKKKILFVAGGLGAAPVYPQVKYLQSRGIEVDVIMGARTKEAIIYEEDMKKIAKNVYIVTDDGSYGRKGLVTD